MEVRRLRADETDSWRNLRLRMLSDAPSAFGATHADALATPADEWARRVEAFAAGETSVVYVAAEDGQFIGSAGAFLDPEDHDRPHLWGMWVAPAARRQGVGRALVEAVAEWARSRGFTSIRLFVVGDNENAAALYLQCGFERTGNTMPLPREPSVLEIEMRRDLRR